MNKKSMQFKTFGLKKTLRVLAAFLVVVPTLSGFVFSAPQAFADPSNLIANPSLETSASGTSPDSWNQGGFGDALSKAQFNYITDTQDTTKAVQVVISSEPTGGDAKWVFNAVPVAQGNLYNFSDSYNSSAPSFLVAAYTMADNSLIFDQLATLPSSNNAWTSTSGQFTAPTGAASVTVYHLIQDAGQLTTDNYSLSLAAPASQNIFSHGIVSLTFDDGWNSQYYNALPVLKSANYPGTFYIISNAMLQAATPQDLFVNEQADIQTANSPSATTWFNISPDPTESSYRFSDTYTATVQSQVTVSYTLPGNVASSTVLGTLPAGTSQQSVFTVMLPALASGSTISITHNLVGAGTLTASNPSLLENTDYMDKDQVLEMQADGEEIGGHNRKPL